MHKLNIATLKIHASFKAQVTTALFLNISVYGKIQDLIPSSKGRTSQI